MERKITYKKATSQDAQEIVNLQNNLSNMLGFDPEWYDDKELINFLNQEIENDQFVCYLAYHDNSVIGGVCVDYSNSLEHEGIEYKASIPLIYVDKAYRNGIISFELFKLALQECKDRGCNNICMSVEDNNPNKDIHLALCDKIIEIREENLDDNNKVSQYVLGVSDIDKFINMPFTKILRKISSSRENKREK